MAILSIRHSTTYRYRKPVRFGEHRMMFRPLESFDQRLITADLEISPAPTQLHYAHDVFGNCVGVARFAEPASELRFESRVELEHSPAPPFHGLGERGDLSEVTLPLVYAPDELPDLARSMERQYSDSDGAVERWARRFLRSRGSTCIKVLLGEMTQAIASDLRYGRRLSGPPQSPEQTLGSCTGSCRDFAVLMMEAVRSLGLAAQFVSGYIHCPPKHGGGLSTVGGGHTHAWLRVFLPVCGWVEFDPTNGIIGNQDLVRVAIARDPGQAVPLWGSFSGDADAFLDMVVEVDVASNQYVHAPVNSLPIPQPDLLQGVALVG